MKILKIN